MSTKGLPRRVVYIVIDGMSTTAFEQVTAAGRAPALDFIKRNGHYARDSVAIFPTITPCATASLVTGETPDRHRIPGMCWYDRDAERFVNYGQSPGAAVLQGVKRIVNDFLFNLNAKHLGADVMTVHEALHELGYVTGSINYMIFRGPYTLEIQPNVLQKLVLRRMPTEIPGPREHYFANLLNGSTEACGPATSKRRLDKRIQATDGWAACVTRDLLEKDAADMILFYLHENDHWSHRMGPHGQVDSLAKADEHIAYVLDSFPTWEQAIDEVGFVVTADHSQSPIGDDDDHVFDLGIALDDFSQVRPRPRGKETFEDKDIAVCGNGRVAFVYLNEDRRTALLAPVVRAVGQLRGIDQVMWRMDGWYVVDSERGRVRFRESDDGTGLRDERGGRWIADGDLDAVSAVVEGDDVRTAEYPLAFWRIARALDLDRCGDVVATTKLTYAVSDLGGGDHRGGGDHASLHAQDSLVPFISTLSNPPLHPTTVDVMPHIVEHFRRLSG